MGGAHKPCFLIFNRYHEWEGLIYKWSEKGEGYIFREGYMRRPGWRISEKAPAESARLLSIF
jgi:hypothetical protein